jgi:hypothetical protein
VKYLIGRGPGVHGPGGSRRGRDARRAVRHMQSSAVQPKVLRRRSKVYQTAPLCRFARRPNQRQCCTTPPATSNGRKARFRVTNHRFRFCHCVDDNFMEPNADYLARRAAHAARASPSARDRRFQTRPADADPASVNRQTCRTTVKAGRSRRNLSQPMR